MEAFGTFISILTSPIVLIAISVPFVLIFGFLIGAYFSGPRHDRVAKLQLENGRGVDYEAKAQDDMNIYCDPVEKGEPSQKFVKSGFALNMLRKGMLGRLTHYALWNGRYGTGYTYAFGQQSKILSLKEALTEYIGEKDYLSIPIEQRNKIEADVRQYKLGEDDAVKITLEETMKNIFSNLKDGRIESTYDLLPEDTKAKIRLAKVGVVVSFPPVPLTPAGMPSISPDDVHRDNDQKVVNALVNGIKKLGTGGPSMLMLMILPMIGVIIGLVLGWVFKIGGTTTTVIEQNTGK